MATAKFCCMLWKQKQKPTTKQGECAGGLARERFLKKPPSSAICCGIWTASDRVRAVGFAYSHDAKQYRLSAFLESALEYFESSKALFKRFNSHCSTVRRLIN